MQFTAFAEFGQFELSSAPCLSQRIYEAIWASLGSNYARDGYTDAKVYATAMALGRIFATQARLEAQLDPATALELLPDLEREYGLIVPATATLASRREALAAQMKLPKGCSAPNLEQALLDLLGSGFLDVWEVDAADAVLDPATPGPPGNFVAPTAARGVYKLPQALSLLGSQTFPLAHQDGTKAQLDELPEVGEALVLSPEHNTQRERVIVTAVVAGSPYNKVTAVLTKAHDDQDRVVRGPWPYWASTKRSSTIRVSAEVAADGIQRAALEALLGRLYRVVSTWWIAGSDGPFVLGTSPLGSTPFAGVP